MIRPLGSLLAVAAIGLLAGCSSAGTTQPGSGSAARASSAGPGSGGSHASAQAGTQASKPVKGGRLDVCRAVPLATVASLTKRKYSGSLARNGRSGGVPVSQCVYTNGVAANADALQLIIRVFRGAPSKGIFAAQDEELGDMRLVPGIGDSAQGDDVELDIAWGRDIVVVQDDPLPGSSTGLRRSVLIALAQKLHRAL